MKYKHVGWAVHDQCLLLWTGRTRRRDAIKEYDGERAAGSPGSFQQRKRVGRASTVKLYVEVGQ